MKTTSKKLKTVLFTVFIFTISLCWSQTSEATYNISVTTSWTVAQHTSVPGSAHWSSLIGAAHSTENEFLELGELATTGIKNVAEFGSNGVFTSEINSAINAVPKRADQMLQDGFSPNNGDNDNAGFTNITVSADFPLVTLVSMVAPSPDWFIAVNSENLRSGDPGVLNGWRNDFTIDVFVYDAGTDNGTNYTSGDSANSPVGIFMKADAPTNGNKMATITFDYVSSTLSVDDIESIKNVKIYPNPVKEILNISNPSNNIESAELYNVLGKKVNTLSTTNSNNLTMNVKTLQSGVYILRLKNTNGDSSTRKVIIE